MDREALVYADLNGQTHLVGRLWARSSKNRESATFEYEAGWLGSQRDSRLNRRSGSALALFIRQPMCRCLEQSTTLRRTGGAGPS